jgi:hypothetical protein
LIVTYRCRSVVGKFASEAYEFCEKGAMKKVHMSQAQLTPQQLLDGGLLVALVLYQAQAQPDASNTMSHRNRLFLFAHSVVAALYVRSGLDLTGEYYQRMATETNSKFVRFAMHTYLFHGLVRAYASVQFTDQIARQMALISYVCEVFQMPYVPTAGPGTSSSVSQEAWLDPFKIAICMSLWIASLPSPEQKEE